MKHCDIVAINYNRHRMNVITRLSVRNCYHSPSQNAIARAASHYIIYCEINYLIPRQYCRAAAIALGGSRARDAFCISVRKRAWKFRPWSCLLPGVTRVSQRIPPCIHIYIYRGYRHEYREDAPVFPCYVAPLRLID